MTARERHRGDESRSTPSIVEVVSPAPAREWRRIAAADRSAMADHAPEWTAAAANWGWRDASRMYRFADGSAVVLPLLHAGGTAPSTVWAASPPAGRGFGGLVGERARQPEVIRSVWDDLAAQRWLSLRVRPSPETGDAWADAAPDSARVVERRAHVLDLAPGPEAILAAMRKSARRSIRRRQGDVTVEVGVGGELLDDYEQLWQRSIGHWAQVQHEPLWLARRRADWRDPPARLRACATLLGDRFRVWVARWEGRPVAANIVVAGPTAHAIRAASDRSVDAPAGIMQYLDWLAIEQACQEGSGAFNLGESGRSDSLGSYKEGLGAVGVDYTEVRLERLAISAADQRIRGLVKRVIRFRD